MKTFEYTKDLQKICETISLKKSFFILPHVNIDGDDLGCMLALYNGLKKLKKEVYLYSLDNIPDIYDFLPDLEKIKKIIPLKIFDVGIALECSSLERMPQRVNLKKNTKLIINIDHHPDNQIYGDLNWVDSKAGALGEMIFTLLEKLNVPLDYSIAESLYTSILTDSGAFGYPNTTSKTHSIVSELVKFPININKINRKIYHEISVNVIRLLGRVLSSLKATKDKKILWSILTKSMMDEEKVKEEDTQHFIEEINKAKEAEVVMLFKEISQNQTKVSFRSKNFPVNKLAAGFGGGGHLRASGCSLNKNLENAQKEIMKKLLSDFRSGGKYESD